MNYKRETRKGDRQAVKIALYGILLSLAMLLGYVETLVPISLGIPGVKLGLANLVNIVSLYLIGTGGTIAIALARIVLLTGFAYGNMAMMIYSLAGRRPQSRTDDFLQKKRMVQPIGNQYHRRSRP